MNVLQAKQDYLLSNEKVIAEFCNKSNQNGKKIIITCFFVNYRPNGMNPLKLFFLLYHIFIIY